MDENTSSAENIEVAEDSNVDTSPVAETNTSVDQETDSTSDEQQVDAAEAEDTNSEAERKPTRAEQRIRELNSKVRQLEQQNQQFQGYQQAPQFQTDENGEITIDSLNQTTAQLAQQIAGQTVQQAIAQERAQNNLDRDIEVISSTYPELDEKSDLYTPELEEAITKEYQEKAFKVVGIDPQTGQAKYQLDPSVRLADVAKRYLDGARALANKSSAEMKNAVARTADETAVRPTGSPSTDKNFSDLSIEEMEAKLGVVRQ